MDPEDDVIELEVFRADPRAARGITPEMLAPLATFDCEAHPVPNVLGHAEGSKPAMDRVRGFRVDGASLFAQIPKAAKAIWDGIKDGSILNRSMAFFPPNHESNPTPGKLAPRHLGWLGGAAAGIPGLPSLPKLAKALSFEADGETLQIDGPPADAIMIAAEPTPLHFISLSKKDPAMAGETEKTPEELAAERRQLDADRLAFEAERRTAYEGENATRVDALIAGGKLLPADKDNALLIFNALAPAPLEFSAATGKANLAPAAALARLLDTGVKLVPVDESRRSPTHRFEAKGGEGGQASDPQAESRRLSARARELMKADTSLSFEAAIEAAQNEQEA